MQIIKGKKIFTVADAHCNNKCKQCFGRTTTHWCVGWDCVKKALEEGFRQTSGKAERLMEKLCE